MPKLPAPSKNEPFQVGKTSGLGWPTDVSRETFTAEIDQLGEQTGLGWPT